MVRDVVRPALQVAEPVGWVGRQQLGDQVHGARVHLNKVVTTTGGGARSRVGQTCKAAEITSRCLAQEGKGLKGKKEDSVGGPVLACGGSAWTG